MMRLIASVPPLLTPCVSKVGQDLGSPAAEGAAKPGDLGDGAGVETVEHLDGNFSAFGRYCVVDRAQLLVAPPGKINFSDRVAGVEATVDLGLLALGEVFDAVPQQPADLIQRVVFVAAAAQGVLLHPTPDLIDYLSP
jgi:hypothetical protein